MIYGRFEIFQEFKIKIIMELIIAFLLLLIDSIIYCSFAMTIQKTKFSRKCV